MLRLKPEKNIFILFLCQCCLSFWIILAQDLHNRQFIPIPHSSAMYYVNQFEKLYYLINIAFLFFL